MSDVDEDRNEPGEGLDEVRRGLASGYRVLIVFLIGAVLGVVAFAVTNARRGSGSQGEWFYFGVGAVVVLGWLLSRLRWVSDYEGPVRRILSVRTARRKLPDGSGQVWQVRFGEPEVLESEAGFDTAEDAGALRFSRGLSIPLAQIPTERAADAGALARIGQELASGADLDAACAAVQPAYAEWNPLERRAYRLYVESLLEPK